MNNKIPTAGLLIRTSYGYLNKGGYYAIMDLSTNKLAVPIEHFNGVRISDNAIGLLAIQRAVRYCVENNLRLTVYAANIISVNWAKKGQFKSRDSEASIHRMAHANASIVFDNDYCELIELWQSRWGAPKDWMHHLIY
jgi:hypothetical protein